MSKINITAGQALSLYQQREQMKGTLIEMLMWNKLQKFQQDNGIRLTSILEKHNKAVTEFYQFDENGVKKDEAGKPILLEGKTEEGYMAAIKEINSQIIPLEI